MKTKIWLVVVIGLSLSLPGHGDSITEEYLEAYFQMFPSEATAAGRHDLDDQLEHLGSDEVTDWLATNRRIADRIRIRLEDPELPVDDRLDLDLILREAERQIFSYETLVRPSRDPLYWTGILGNATVFLLVRDDGPQNDRLSSAAARAAQIPRLSNQAQDTLAKTDPGLISADLCGMAERQARSISTFYREGFPLTAESAPPALRAEIEDSGEAAAAALEGLADFLAELGTRATGSVRLGDLYPEKFRLVTGIEKPVKQVLKEAEEALERKIQETASYGRSQWPEVFPGTAAPTDDRELIRSLFDRVSEDRAETVDEFITDYRDLVDHSVEFVRQHRVMTLPEPLTLHLDRSPSFFIGQSVGGVYPAGPYAAPDAKTLLFLPTPSDEAPPEQRDAFFRDFNHHFNVMITPHELIPGHYLQLKYAAQHPRKVRALFGDGVYIEGWGTFAERLMLDLGWGEPLDRMAHLKKQLENIARTIVDIRVHTEGMTREEVLEFVQVKALQEQQFAGNMWRRSITSSPQLTYYYLGYSEVWGLYSDVRRAQGDDFELKAFMDGMMVLGPVPVRHYRSRMLPSPAN